MISLDVSGQVAVVVSTQHGPQAARMRRDRTDVLRLLGTPSAKYQLHNSPVSAIAPTAHRHAAPVSNFVMQSKARALVLQCALAAQAGLGGLLPGMQACSCCLRRHAAAGAACARRACSGCGGSHCTCVPDRGAGRGRGGCAGGGGAQAVGATQGLANPFLVRRTGQHTTRFAHP